MQECGESLTRWNDEAVGVGCGRISWLLVGWLVVGDDLSTRTVLFSLRGRDCGGLSSRACSAAEWTVKVKSSQQMAARIARERRVTIEAIATLG